MKLAPESRSALRDLVVITHRTPPTGDREHATLERALEPALRDRDGIWIGWNGRTQPRPAPLAIDEASRPSRASFPMSQERHTQFDTGFCSSALWPLFHGFRSRVRYNDADWEGYVRANDTYARHAVEVSSLDGVVWVHDYHLLLTASALRRLGHRGPIGMFLHIPFPARDLLETMPWAHELLDAMLHFDLLGFQTERWAENFMDAVRSMRGVTSERSIVRRNDHATLVRVLPVPADRSCTSGIDDESSEIVRLRGDLGDRKLLLAIDTLDLAKGIPERLEAFQRLLERSTEWHGKVVLLQVAVPSQIERDDDLELRSRIELMVGRINGRFGEADWIPIRYLQRGFDPRVLAQLCRLADVGLVTPLRDGMNLVAKEFVAAQEPDQPGVLVLSHYAGAAEELTAAVLTNPFHPEGLASDIDRALRMPLEERVQRHRNLAAVVATSAAPDVWAAEFLYSLSQCAVVGW